MLSYAVLGATGTTGGAIVKLLSQRENVSIHAFVRSAKKLEAQEPDLLASKRLHIFEGQMKDTQMLAKCIHGTRAVFICIAASENVPYCTIAQDVARAVIAAMKELRAEYPDHPLPRLIQLSSSSIDEKLSESLPSIAHAILYRGNWWIYEDLKIARNMLASEPWIDCTYMMPGGLIQAPQTGHKLSTEKQQTFLGWLDLAAGMIEVADEKSEVWRGKNVSVLPLANDVPINWMVPLYMAIGLILTYLPWLYRPAKRVGLM